MPIPSAVTPIVPGKVKPESWISVPTNRNEKPAANVVHSAMKCPMGRRLSSGTIPVELVL